MCLYVLVFVWGRLLWSNMAGAFCCLLVVEFGFEFFGFDCVARASLIFGADVASCGDLLCVVLFVGPLVFVS